jgi:nucleotide-binding universal stress UspA family protein
MEDEKMKPIMLALSTFRQSDNAVQLAIEKAKTNKNLVVAYIVDENLARYLIGIDTELSPKMKENGEREILEEDKIQAKTKVESIVATAREVGINVVTYIDIARFGIKCVEIAKKEKPELIITTRTKRPQWVKKLFGSPVDYLIEHAGCPVKEA